MFMMMMMIIMHRSRDTAHAQKLLQIRVM